MTTAFEVLIYSEMEGERNGDPIRPLRDRIDGLEKKVSELRPKPLSWDIDRELLDLKGDVSELESRISLVEQDLQDIRSRLGSR